MADEVYFPFIMVITMHIVVIILTRIKIIFINVVVRSGHYANREGCRKVSFHSFLQKIMIFKFSLLVNFYPKATMMIIFKIFVENRIATLLEATFARYTVFRKRSHIIMIIMIMIIMIKMIIIVVMIIIMMITIIIMVMMIMITFTSRDR